MAPALDHRPEWLTPESTLELARLTEMACAEAGYPTRLVPADEPMGDGRKPNYFFEPKVPDEIAARAAALALSFVERDHR